MLNNTQTPEVIKQENSKVKRYDLVNHVMEKYSFSTYLEIGVAFGHSIRAVKAAVKDGVDPVVEEQVQCPEINYRMTSDEFFALEETQNKKYDVIFIDGLHHSDQIDVDIQNSLNHLSDNGFIFLHDCNPVSYESQLVPRQAVAWNGDGWKSIIKVRYNNKDLKTCVVDTDYGVGVIKKETSQGINQESYSIEDCLTWEYFTFHKIELLDLITPEEFYNRF